MGNSENYLDSLSEEQKKTIIRKTSYRLNKLLNPTIDEQTIMFWNLQLQFMSMDRFYLGCVALYHMSSSTYVRNSYSNKAKRLSNYARWESCKFTENQHNCLATHLALQLSGVE